MFSGKLNSRSLVLLFTCTFVSPDEGPRRSETSHLLIKSFELRCHAYIFGLFICIYINIHV